MTFQNQKIITILLLLIITFFSNAKNNKKSVRNNHNKTTDSLIHTCRILKIEKIKNHLINRKIIHKDEFGGIVKTRVLKNHHPFINENYTNNKLKAYMLFAQDIFSNEVFTIVSVGNNKIFREKVKSNRVYDFKLKKYFPMDFIISLGFYFEVNIKEMNIWVPMGVNTNNIFTTSNLDGIYYQSVF